MVYTPTGEPFTVDTSGLEGKRIMATWLNPLNGEESPVDAEIRKGKVDFQPPTADGHPDWTLVLEIEGKGCNH